MAEETIQAPGAVLPAGNVLEPQSGTVETTPEAPAGSALVEADLLVEDVSIDGMCGVY